MEIISTHEEGEVTFEAISRVVEEGISRIYTGMQAVALVGQGVGSITHLEMLHHSRFHHNNHILLNLRLMRVLLSIVQIHDQKRKRMMRISSDPQRSCKWKIRMRVRRRMIRCLH